MEVSNSDTEADPLTLLRTDPTWRRAEEIYEERKLSHVLERVGREKFKKLYPGKPLPPLPLEPAFDPGNPLAMSLLYPYRDTFDDETDLSDEGEDGDDYKEEVNEEFGIMSEDEPGEEDNLLSDLDTIVKAETEGINPQSQLYRDLHDIAFSDPFGDEDDELDDEDPHNEIDMDDDAEFDYLQLDDDDTDIVVRVWQLD
jgi:hypothetical protein